jgi:hypothetical protein
VGRPALRVVCPYTEFHPLAEAVLKRHAPQAEYFYVGQTDQSYFNLLAEVWAAGCGFLLVEHDIEIRAGVVREARACPEPWCTWPYSGPGWSDPAGDALWYESLGCVRFSTQLLAAEPDLMSVAYAITDRQGRPAGDWRALDVSIAPTLKDRGYRAHHHRPVLHHHFYPPEGCSCGGQHG